MTRTHPRAALAAAAVALALGAAIAPAPAADASPAFGIESFEVQVRERDGSPAVRAGGHPYELTASIALNTVLTSGGETVPVGDARDISIDLPPGLVGVPRAVPQCPPAALFDEACSAESQVGTASLAVEGNLEVSAPIYDLVPLPGHAEQFGIVTPGGSSLITAGLRAGAGYGLRLTDAGIPEIGLTSLTLSIWGVPADPAHDPGRGETCIGSACSGGGEHSEAPLRPFLTEPVECSGESQTVTASADSWLAPGAFATKEATLLPLRGCGGLAFEPKTSARPDARAADSPAGLALDLEIPQNAAPMPLDSEGKVDYGANLATAEPRDATVALPAGLSLNPSSAYGLDACTESEAGFLTAEEREEPARCPDAARVGTAEVETPLLDHPLPGAIYLAQPYENPFGSQLALYVAIDDPASGTIVKLAGELGADAQTGRLTATLPQIPRLPFEALRLRFFGGSLGLFRTPAVCGGYQVTSRLTPWSHTEVEGGGEVVEATPIAEPGDEFEIAVPASGASVCPDSASQEPSAPTFVAGSESARAGAFSPFALRLRREDGSQELAKIDTTFPPGLIGRLAGVGECSNAQLAAAASHSGTEEQAGPSCPPNTEVGTVDVGAGAGPTPLYVKGHAYLAGPYKGAPLSLAIVTPAVAGPLDLGTVVVRTALFVNPATAQVHAVSDEIPHILQGIPLDVRSVAVKASRPHFTLNPTNCSELGFTGSALTVLGASASLAERFQVADCAALPFKPRLSLLLSNGARNGHPALRAVLRARPQEAGIAATTFTLPAGELLDLHHVPTLCARELPPGRCPPASRIGYARVWSPLLEGPLEGPIYLREPSHRFPDLLVDLRSAQLHFLLRGHVAAPGGRLRVRFPALPDIPLSRALFTLAGGRRGIFANSEALCGRRPRGEAAFSAHSGKRRLLRPRLRCAP